MEEFDEEISDYEEQVGREHYVDNSLDMGSDSEGSINSRRGYNSPVFGSKEALTSSEIASFPTMFW